MIKELIKQLKAEVPSDLKFTSTILLLGKLFGKLDGRVIDLEARQLQKGDKGDKGIDGRDGKNGIDGKDGRNGIDGKNGKDGKDGKDGKTGKAGVSVVDASVDLDGSLVLKLSNGSIIDAGDIMLESQIKGIISTTHVPDQITISAIAPASPYLNQLWYDIS